MNEPTWLEVALNGPWSRSRQPKIPVLADEIGADAIRCAEAGVAILHFHAYDPVSGRQRDDYDIYAPIIERIRAKVDVICYPTVPFAGSMDAPNPLTAAQRFSAVEKLVEAGLKLMAQVMRMCRQGGASVAQGTLTLSLMSKLRNILLPKNGWSSR